MTRDEMWDEFESQLKREIHTPITMSYDDIIRLAELGIEETVARWKPRLEQGTCEDCISKQDALEVLECSDFVQSRSFENNALLLFADDVKKNIRDLPSVQPKTKQEPCDDCISRQAVLDIDFNRICVTCAKPGEMIRQKIAELPPIKPQEPKTDGDCISRKDLLKKCVHVPIAPLIAGEKVFCEKVVFSMDIINAEPIKQEQKTGWIPVSERLPEEDGEYMITWKTSASKKHFIGVCEYEMTDEFDHERNRFNVEWLLEDYIKSYPDVEVIAWLPLPEPYKEGEK